MSFSKTSSHGIFTRQTRQQIVIFNQCQNAVFCCSLILITFKITPLQSPINISLNSHHKIHNMTLFTKLPPFSTFKSLTKKPDSNVSCVLCHWQLILVPTRQKPSFIENMLKGSGQFVYFLKHFPS